MAKETAEIYRSRLTKRWHNVPEIESQTVGDHTVGMLLLLMALHPKPSADLYEAILRHDLAEIKWGDFPSNAKKEFPAIKKADEIGAEEFAKDQELRDLKLSQDDKIWIEFLDKLEPLHYLQEQCFLKPKAQEIFVKLTERCNGLVEQLQFLGYLLEPDDTIH